MPTKDPGIAAIIALVGGLFGFMGLGHIYVGRISRGLIILVGGIVLYFIGLISLFLFGFLFGLGGFVIGIVLLILALALFIWQTYDANQLAKQYNEAIRQTGRAPW